MRATRLTRPTSLILPSPLALACAVLSLSVSVSLEQQAFVRARVRAYCICNVMQGLMSEHSNKKLTGQMAGEGIQIVYFTRVVSPTPLPFRLSCWPWA